MSSKLDVTINMQVEVPGHGKWWLDGKTRFDKALPSGVHVLYCHSIGSGQGQGDHNGALIPISPTAECICMLSNPMRINGIKSKGMQASREGKGVGRAEQLSDLHNGRCPPKFQTSRSCSQKVNLMESCTPYSILCKDPDLSVGYADLCPVVCGVCFM